VGPNPAEVTAVVPARNAEQMLPRCLEALRQSGVAEIIVVDGCSTDGTVDLALAAGARVLSDEGRGLPWARTLGVQSSSTRWVLLVDSDVVFGPGGVADLLTELVEEGYDALQAGLESVAGPGYWGQALARHHRTGRSRNWFGLVATVVDRELMLGVGFDDSFKSGEDIELRWRMRKSGMRTAVSRRVVVEHRFAADDFDFALDQFLMDGTGLGRMIRKHGWRGARLALLPAAAAVRGSALSLAGPAPVAALLRRLLLVQLRGFGQGFRVVSTLSGGPSHGRLARPALRPAQLTRPHHRQSRPDRLRFRLLGRGRACARPSVRSGSPLRRSRRC
jgi:GT2 family glycosyltransferase